MNDNWKLKKVEKLGSDYRLTVGPNRESDPEAVLAVTVGAILAIATFYVLSLFGIKFSLLLGFGLWLFWSVVHVAVAPITTVAALISVVVFVISLFFQS
jgi:hypothetical protein